MGSPANGIGDWRGSPLQERLSVGAQILHQRFGGTEITLDGMTYALFGKAEIMPRHMV